MMEMMMLISTLIIMSAPSWWGVWVGMELFNLFFIPYCCSYSKVISVSVWQYYVIQVISSLMILCFSTVLTYPGWMDFSEELSSMMLGLLGFIILMKMGFPPFHGWVLRVSGEIPWLPFMFLSTVGKIGPIMFLINLPNISEENFSIFWLIMACFGLISSLSSVKESNVRHIVVYSSVLNLSWLIVSAHYSSSVSMMLIMSYFMSVIVISMILKEKSISQVNDLYEGVMSMPLLVKVLFLISFLNLIGFPPSLTFFVKVSILKMISLSWMKLILILVSVVFVFNYMKLVYFVSMKSPLSKLTPKLFKKKYSIYSILIPISVMTMTILYFSTF